MNKFIEEFNIEHNQLNSAIFQTLNCLKHWDDLYNDWYDMLQTSPDVWNKSTLRDLQNDVYCMASAEMSYSIT